MYILINSNVLGMAKERNNSVYESELSRRFESFCIKLILSCLQNTLKTFLSS